MKFPSWHLCVFAFIFFFCSAAAPAKEVRALWVARGEYNDANDVKNIIENAAKMNFNVILFQVRGNGTVFYKSKIEPWAFELSGRDPKNTGKDPGWDPLATAIAAAKKSGVELHAWVNVFPAWRSQRYAPKQSGQLWWSHPDWFMCDAAGKPMLPRDHRVDPKVEDWYAFLSPGIPEVQDYLANLFEELAANYEIDGLHFDYIRYPREIHEVDSAYAERAKKLGNWSYDPVSLKRFTTDTNVKTPDDNPKAWTKWRADQVTMTVRKIAQKTRVKRPNLIITAAVGADPVDARDGKAQSYVEWLEMGDVDAVMLMGYTPDNAKFKADRQAIMSKRPSRGSIIAGIGMNVSEKVVAEQIEITRAMKFDGFCGFSARPLFDLAKNYQPTALADAVKKSSLAEKSEVVWKKP